MIEHIVYKLVKDNQEQINELSPEQQKTVFKLLENVASELVQNGNLNNICTSKAYNDDGSIFYEIVGKLNELD